MALGESLCLFCFVFSITLAYWYGFECIQGTSNCPQKSYNPYDAGTVVTIFFGMLLPAINLNQFTPTFKSIAEGKMAAARIFSIIDREPTIKSGVNKVML
jgi:ATP-binding cassette, subfamily B (MDR/TAP), member 1